MRCSPILVHFFLFPNGPHTKRKKEEGKKKKKKKREKKKRERKKGRDLSKKKINLKAYFLETEG